MRLQATLGKLATQLGTVNSPTCPRCGQVILQDDINVGVDVAYCRRCNLSHKLSSLTHSVKLDEAVDITAPPPGAWYRTDGTTRIIGATHRSLGAAAGLLVFSLFWNGIVSVFVAVAVAATVNLMGMEVPAWFPSPIMNGSVIGTGMAAFLWLFLTPFIVIGAVMFAAFLACIAGYSEVRIAGPDSESFSGIGTLGIRRPFDAAAVKDVRIDDRRWRDGDGDARRNTKIVIETASGQQLSLGSMLTDERRRFVASAARLALMR